MWYQSFNNKECLLNESWVEHASCDIISVTDNLRIIYFLLFTNQNVYVASLTYTKNEDTQQARWVSI